MRIIFTVLLTALLSNLLHAQGITGTWNGLLKVQGSELRLVFHIEKTASGYTSTMDSPDQGAKGIPVGSTSFENDSLKLSIPQAGISYIGVFAADSTIQGTFKQGPMTFPMLLSKGVMAKQAKPQEPTKPYPYRVEELTFENKKAGNRLAGTLTLPQQGSNFPVVILISGSGQHNRDGEMLGHKPFLVLADHLTKNGIAVLRFDDRGVAASTGDFSAANSADFATDVEAGIAYLKTRKEINPKKIGLIGHSEGGIIAPMVGSRSKDVAFMVLLAGSGLPGDQILLLQQGLIGKASGMSEQDLDKLEETNKAAFALVHQAKSSAELKASLTNAIQERIASGEIAVPAGLEQAEFIAVQVNRISSPWMQYFITYDPAPALEKVSCPVLSLIGSKDLQVPADENLAAINKALAKGGNKQVTSKKLPNLNHLFQESETGAPDEYAKIEQTLSPIALDEVLSWIKLQTN